MTLQDVLSTSSKDIFKFVDIASAGGLSVKDLMAKAVLVMADLLYKIEENTVVVYGYKSSKPNISMASHLRLTSQEMIIEGYPYVVIPSELYAKTTDTGFGIDQFTTLAKIDSDTKKIALRHALNSSECQDLYSRFFASYTPVFLLCDNEPYTPTGINSLSHPIEKNVDLTFFPIKQKQKVTDSDLWLHRNAILEIFPSIISASEPQIDRPWMNGKLIALNIACVKYYAENSSDGMKKIQVEKLQDLIKKELIKVNSDDISATALGHCVNALKPSKRTTKLIPTKQEKGRYHPMTAPSLIKMNEISRALHEENLAETTPDSRLSNFQRAESLAMTRKSLPVRSIKSLAPFMIPKPN